MKSNEHSSPQNQKLKHSLMSSSNTIAVFTVLNILLRMKNQLGLEAMMEYLDSYVKMIGQSNPGVQVAVNRAVGLLSMEKLYKDALSR